MDPEPEGEAIFHTDHACGTFFPHAQHQIWNNLLTVCSLLDTVDLSLLFEGAGQRWLSNLRRIFVSLLVFGDSHGARTTRD